MNRRRPRAVQLHRPRGLDQLITSWIEINILEAGQPVRHRWSTAIYLTDDRAIKRLKRTRFTSVATTHGSNTHAYISRCGGKRADSSGLHRSQPLGSRLDPAVAESELLANYLTEQARCRVKAAVDEAPKTGAPLPSAALGRPVVQPAAVLQPVRSPRRGPRARDSRLEDDLAGHSRGDRHPLRVVPRPWR
jgi:hypothetical protein